MSRRDVPKSARRALDLRYLATFRSSAHRSSSSRKSQVQNPPPAADVFAKELQNDVQQGAAAESRTWPHFVFATNAQIQPCFDAHNNPIEGADLDVDERVMLVLDRDECRTTRVTTDGDLVTTRVDKSKFKDFQPLP